jgi:hypothetical protein
MRLLKIILIIFIIYFVKRFIQMYRSLKTMQERPPTSGGPNVYHSAGVNKSEEVVVDAEYKVID